MTTLFRKEAVESRKNVALGDVLVVAPPSHALLLLAVVVLAAVITIYLATSELARKETAQGYLVPDKGLVKILPPFSGTVIERHVQEGDVVNPGDALFVVISSRGTRETPDIDAALISKADQQRLSLVERLEQTRRSGIVETRMLEREIDGLEQELHQAEKELLAQRRRLNLGSENLERYRDLAKHGHLSEQQLHDQEREHLAWVASLNGLERNRLSLQRQLETARSRIDLVALQTANAVADYQGRIAEMEQRIAELDARAEYVVRAPIHGTATNIALEPGQTVTANAPLLALVPVESRLEALVYIPTRAAGFVKPGMEVRMRYDAFPYQRFGLSRGTINRISRSVLVPAEMDTPVPVREPVYTAVVTLEHQEIAAYGDRLPLQPGMLLQADIILDRQSLFGWLLDPLYAATGSL